MATATALNKLASSVTGLTNAVSQTFVEQAKAISNAAREAFGNANWEVDKAELTTVVNSVEDGSSWKGTSSADARKSEVRSIVIAYPFLGAAAATFKQQYGELRREHLVKIARICPESETADDAAMLAVEFFETRDQKKAGGNKASKAKAIPTLVSEIFNVQTRSRNLIAFRKDLAKLCEKHDITTH